MSQELAPRFDPSAIEGPLYRRWSENGHFHVDAAETLESGRDPYVIVIPPPNVTAVLHMGHGLNNSIQDVLIRFRRMQGRASEWLPGTDHAGIATQNVVERLLAREGITRDDLGREAFVERVWDFVNETGSTILEQLKAIGSSCDWERTAFTLDPNLSAAVREVFVRLYEKDLIYRGEYIINWCPRCLTALSNEEAEGTESEGRLWHLRYPLPESAWGAAETARDAGAEALGRFESGGWYLTVSTTRPETMLGDQGVAVNPNDERYRALVGAEVELPLTGRTIPIVADAFVDPEFGTGMVKVTPAHDPNDFEIARRTDLPLLNIFTDAAVVNDEAPEAFRGMDRFDARKAVLAALSAEGLLAGEDAHTHSVPRCYRCDTVVEPRLSLQWFVRMAPLAEPALEASRDGTITFTPPRWKKVYEHWMENIRDWCISRQLWWGHRIPVWYCDACDGVHVLREAPGECPDCGGEVRQDPDVLDTWFSSWLWPMSPFGWPDETPDLKAFYPGHTLVTAPEILFFWVARMIMAGYEFMGEPPFREVFLHGTVRDAQGRKMSKSLGNGIDPMEVVDRFGADAMRFTIISQCAIGTDIHLDHEDIEAAFANGRNFANKVWNVGRFTLMSVGDAPVRPLAAVGGALEPADRWILSRLEATVARVTDDMERFRLHEVADTLYHFFWGDLADWYLELVKNRIRGEEGDDSREAARSTLVTVLDGVMRLLHPLIPFVTTALWDRLPWPEGEARPEELMVAAWPTAERGWSDPAAEASIADLQEFLTAVRSLRKEYGVGEGEGITVHVDEGDSGLRATLGDQMGPLERMGRVTELRWAPAPEGAIGAHAVLRSGADLFLPLEGVVDLEKERQRLRDEIERIEGRRASTRKKLDNANFVDRAPAEVVEKEREKLRTATEQLAGLREKLDLLEGRA
ncbi:valine--tRNA ligase [Gaopeijia maritima]|uniref:valine--tRNA ligase n=1 Tax=Gaopeijia maritima TaxID=3119007 RepID=UPI00324527EF